MGISGLLPLLKDIQNSKHLSEFRGQTLAVDGYVWLHRGTYGCAAEVATGKPTSKYVEYAMHRVRLLRHYGIQPYLVFDGGPLPAKQGTEDGRKQRREENLSRANTLAAQGKHSQAREFYVKCVDVTPQMAYQLIKALRAEGVPYVVAPYEADAQLAYLERVGVVDGIITEDSDLLVFGCKKVLFKLDTTTSKVTCISREDFAAVASTSTGGLSLRGWTDAQFRTMAILSGCDYLPSIPGIGLKTAWTLLRKHKTVENMLSALRLEGKKKVPTGYLDAFRLAEKVFLHQRVYDPAQEELIHLTPLPEDEAWDAEKEAYIGA
ncbi:PIN domain-like protein [Lentinus tigrinus ALCF2SS1-7]|uniref:PIN domain-like protein n=1 Tax=Lentinus tigrinus ALCF2SS1-7 TaxID=1328758 RepID=UPI001165EBBE|nr:PIN domain-like protein [Lentinus tigrinus ALCF2SS1-7]